MMPLLANKYPPANPGAQEAAAAADGLIPDVLAPETSYCEPAPAPTRPRPHASPALAATSDFSQPQVTRSRARAAAADYFSPHPPPTPAPVTQPTLSSQQQPQ